MSKIDSLKKKIKYRSEYRGIKEMDLLLGNFVKKYVDTFNYEELLDLYKILERDDNTIFKWYSGTMDSGEIEKNNVSNLLKKFKL
tara:strand:+ start:539 stop:793 length:255 start_codon:yes stop_codon:yes gene_type:complete